MRSSASTPDGFMCAIRTAVTSHASPSRPGAVRARGHAAVERPIDRAEETIAGDCGSVASASGRHDSVPIDRHRPFDRTLYSDRACERGRSLPRMTCPVCGGDHVAFAVPAPLRQHAPESTGHAAICSSCLRVHAAGRGPSTPDFERIHPAFPTGEAGAAVALALGLLDSLALRRDAIDDCCSFAERAGADVLLTLDRLATADGLTPHFDVERRRHQVAEMLR